MLAFKVTLSRAASGTVTVDYATADGTATAGADYTAASDTLTFAAGETAKTVSVTVLDDSHNEGTETMTLTLSNASGARIADATATGTIENSDLMPAAWLARFGRTVAEQVVDAVAAIDSANAGLLECRGPTGPSERAGSGGEDRELVKVVDGLRAGKTQRQIAVDIYGADAVAADWHSDGWIRSQVRRWMPKARAMVDGGWRDLVPRRMPDE